MIGDRGVKGGRDCAGERGSRRRELATAREDRRARAEEAGKRVLFCVKAQRDGGTPKRAKDTGSREWFHAAEVSNGGERSWISAAVSRSMTTIGPPHLGQRQRSFELQTS